LSTHILPEKLAVYLNDPFRRNALFLISTYSANALIGFFFWTVAARLFSPDDVGKATSLISAGFLVAQLSGLGLGIGLMRFLSEEQDKVKLINSTASVTLGMSLLLSCGFLLGINLWSPGLSFIYGDCLDLAAFVLFSAVFALNTLFSQVFIALCTAQYALYQSLIFAAKIAVLFLMLTCGYLGVFISFTAGVMISCMAAVLLLRNISPQYLPRIAADISSLNKMMRFSLGNYTGDTFKTLTGFVAPLIIINLLGPAMSAYFYIGWMVAGIFFNICYAINFTLATVGAHEPVNIRWQTIKSVRFVTLILVPSVILMYFLGGFLLSFFGKQYSEEALWLLRILSIASLPLAVNEIFIAVCRIRKRIKPVIIIYGTISFFTLIAGSMLTQVMGLVGIGIAFLTAQTATALALIIINRSSIFKPVRI
jgi:O-antigen/teichoic acid export membrane protein